MDEQDEHPSAEADAAAGDRLPAAIDALVRDAMACCDGDPARAEFLFNFAVSQAPHELALYRVLYKFHNRRRRFDAAFEFARRGLGEAARQAGLTTEALAWNRAQLRDAAPAPASHALHAIKALAFLSLRMDRPDQASRYLDQLAELDPDDGVGGSVVRAMADSLGK